MIKVREFKEHNYKSVYFAGKTIRFALDPTKDIEELTYPEFYDVKITDYCEGNCSYCYMDSTCKGLHHTDILGKIDSYFGTMSNNERPFQVAIGGGEPTAHPEFIECLIKFSELGITPNYTTNGMNLTEDIISATEEYCQGVAVSCHPHLNEYWTKAAENLSGRGIKLNFHIIISDKESINRFIDTYNEWNKLVDYFVLLPYGSQGRAEEKEIDWEYLVSVLPEDLTQVAFGANFHKYLVNSNITGVSLYEPESMSKFLDLKDMKLYGSSFNYEQNK